MGQSASDLSNQNSENTVLIYKITEDKEEILQAQQLRYRIFAECMGANLPNSKEGIDQDSFDEVCHHLIVKDTQTNQVVACSRIITNEGAQKAGGFYSSTEFDLTNIIIPDKKYMEIGRTCVDPEYRSGSAMILLFSGLANFLEDHKLDYLMGCASIPLDANFENANAIVAHLEEHHYTDKSLRVYPKVGLPNVNFDKDIDAEKQIPPLLAAYLRIGVKVCGEPFWDKEFNVADAFILLKREEANQRYMKRFLKNTVN